MVLTLTIKSLVFLSIFLCLYLVSTSNPIYSAFSLIALFLTTSTIFLVLNIKFLTFVIIILYAGAVSILFLFIIFTLNLKTQAGSIKPSLLSTSVLSIALLKLTSSLISSMWTNTLIMPAAVQELKNSILLTKITFEWHEIELVGNLLYSHYGLLFLLIGYVLLLVMIGVVVISKSLNFSYTSK